MYRPSGGSPKDRCVTRQPHRSVQPRTGSRSCRATTSGDGASRKGPPRRADLIPLPCSCTAAHESPKTTKLYDRTSDAITLDEVERIAI
ncbi:hypothetical protein TsocGM_23440 [Tautonia sociabilis]|uniref:Uncharacterized protein n=1 Tax=Tautonia sociabilis TaxID=2080755 RepID=A0A432MDG6_9BACT|nr:hypothetical protein TsocGM_23440 [Tautonia sociabilis]